MKSNFVTTPEGTKYHYLEAGNELGPLLICLHGLGGSTATFEPLLPRLSNSYRAILLDFPGFGQSPPPNERPTVAKYVSHLEHVITTLRKADGDKVILVGHSLGTAIALHFAAQHPSTVAGLILLGTARSASHVAAVRERMMNMANSTRENGIAWAAELASKSNFAPEDKQRPVDDALRAEVAKAVGASDTEAYALTCEMMVDESHKDPDYGRITCPTVLIAGDVDMISPIERSTGLAKLIGSKTCWVEAVMSGHQPILEDLDGVAGAVGRLLREI